MLLLLFILQVTCLFEILLGYDVINEAKRLFTHGEDVPSITFGEGSVNERATIYHRFPGKHSFMPVSLPSDLFSANFYSQSVSIKIINDIILADAKTIFQSVKWGTHG